MKNNNYSEILLRAVYWRLNQAGNVFDPQTRPQGTLNGTPLYSIYVPKNAKYPYILLDYPALDDFSTKTEDGQSGSMQITAFDQSDSAARVSDFMKTIYLTLQNFDFDFSLFNTRNLDFSSVQLTDFRVRNTSLDILEKDTVMGSMNCFFSLI